MSKNREKKHAAHVADRKAHEQEIAEAAAEHHETHLVEAPKGTSRSRFIFNLLLVVFLLLIFSITGPMMSTLTGGGQPTGEIYMAWTTPDGDRVELETTKFYEEKRKFARLEFLAPFLLLGQVEASEDYQTARFLILESLADRAGIYVADTEVADTIVEAFGGAEGYTNWLSVQRDLSASAFENILRRGLMVRRYLQISSATAGEVLTEDVIDRWKLGAEEFNFEYVEVLAEDFREEAEANVLPDDELEAWFMALNDFQKRPFMSDRAVSADLAWFDPSAEGDYSALFESYPRPEDEDAEQMAQNFYNGFSHVRFAKPVPETDEEQKAAEEAGESKYFSFDEVADQVRKEAPVYYSMMDWLSHMQLRKSEGEAVDLQTEAITLGIKYERVAPRSRDDWLNGEEPWAGRYFFGSITPEEGAYSQRVAVEEDALVIAQILEVRDPQLPENFADYRDEVAAKWVDERIPELTAEKLEAVRDAFGERPEEGEFETTATAEEFKAAVEAAGWEVQERGYDRQFPRPGGDDDRPTQAEFFIRAKSILFTLDQDTVIAAEATRDGKAAYLMRVAGKREGDPMTMLPSEASDAINQLRSSSQSAFFSGTVNNQEWVIRTYNLMLRSLEDEEEGA